MLMMCQTSFIFLRCLEATLEQLSSAFRAHLTPALYGQPQLLYVATAGPSFAPFPRALLRRAGLVPSLPFDTPLRARVRSRQHCSGPQNGAASHPVPGDREEAGGSGPASRRCQRRGARPGPEKARD